ncbi:Ig-like domain-containing protein [Budvicia diplopodorum]|uniref:Ig-like domain-containing protein n=1 Tax=Budvicia diplopodorum TaxID=1119056 RepID=UPI00135A5233|nr:Ig-like domain-containing protein [Budvicia diplopodorum]
MSNLIQVKLRGVDGVIKEYQVMPGNGSATNIAIPKNGKVNIELLDQVTGKAPHIVTYKRIGNNLVMSFGDGSDITYPDIVFENYYELNLADVHIIGLSESGQYYEFIPTSGELQDYAPEMADGAVTQAALGGNGFIKADPEAGGGDNGGFLWWALAMGVIGLGAAAAAYASNNDDDNDKDDSRSPAPVPTSVTNIISDSITLTDDVNPVTGLIKDGGVTNDTRPTYSGTATSDAVYVRIYDNGQVVATVTVGADGKWSYTPENALAEGSSHEFSVSAVDKYGNESVRVSGTNDSGWNFTIDGSTPDNSTSGIVKGSIMLIDDVAPVTGLIADGGSTNDTRPTYAGKATKDVDYVKIYDNGSLIATVKVGADGKWSYTPENSLAEGSVHEFSVSAVDKAGNEGARVSGTNDSGWNFTIDSVSPDNKTSGIVKGSITLTDDVAPVTGPIADGGHTNDTRPTYAGKATADIDRVKIYDNGTLVATVSVDKNGNWSYTPESALAEGSSHAYSVSAVDKAGNEGARVSGTTDAGWNFTVDTVAPGGNDAFTAGSIRLMDDVGPVQGLVVDGSVIDDTQPVYSGTITAEALATGISEVVIYDRGVEIGRAAVNQTSGEWSFEPAMLERGTHSFTVAVVDRAGNVGPQVSGTTDAAWDFTLVIGAPAAPAIENVRDDATHGDDADTGLLQKGQATNDRTLILAGTAGAGLTINVYATNSEGTRVKVGETTADANGEWTITTSELGADGLYNLTAIAVNGAGVVSPETGVFPVLLDTQAPAGAVGQLMDNKGDVKGVVAPGGITDDSAPVITGQGAEAGAMVSIYVDNALVGSTTVNESGNWSVALGPLTDGEHSYQTKITDTAGNETKSAAVAFTVDTSDIVISIDLANDNVGNITTPVLAGGTTDDTTPELQGRTQPNAVVTVRDADGVALGSSTANASGVWRFVLPVQAEGTHSYTAEAQNAAGNLVTASFTLTVDITAPTLPTIVDILDDVGSIQSPIVQGGVTDDQTPTFTGKGEAGSIVTIYDGANVLGRVTVNETGDWSYTPTESLIEGPHSITVTGTDAVGNESAHSPQRTFDVDVSTSAPVVLVNTLEELSGTAEPGAKVTVTDPSDNSITEVVVDQDGKWSLRPNPLEKGDKDAVVAAVDPAGNTNSTNVDGPKVAPDNDTSGIVSGSITLTDDVAPVTGRIADGGYTNDTRPTYAGKATADIDRVKIYDNGTLVATVSVDENGNWSFTPENALAEGSSHAYTVSAVDNGGLEGPAVSGTTDAGWNFTIDTVAPGGNDAFTAGSIRLMDAAGPVQGLVVDGSVIDDTQPVYSGTITAEALATGISEVVIYDRGVEIGRAAVNQTSGEWSFEPAMLERGTHSFTVAVVDRAGNVGPQVSGTTDAAWDFTLVIGAPAAPAIENVRDDATHGDDADIGLLQKGQATNDRTLILTGTAGAGLTINVYATNSEATRVKVGETTADANGEWTITTSELGADGLYNLTAIAVNGAGVVSPETGVFPVLLDTQVPAGAVGQLMDNKGNVKGVVAPGGITDDSAPVITGQGTEAGAMVSIYVDNALVGSTTVNESGNWSVALGPLTDGEHSYQTKITDTAGNETKSAAVAFTVDTSDIVISIDLANDNVGNITTPVLAGGTTDDTTPELQGRTQPNAVVTVRDADGVALGSSTANASGVWSFVLPVQAEGTHSYTAEAQNAAGNLVTASFTLTVDTTAPTLPTVEQFIDDVGIYQGTVTALGTVTDDQTPTFTGKGDAGSIVTIYDGEHVLGRVTVNETGDWSYTPTTSLVEGPHSITVTGTDAVGNESAHTSPWSFVLDVTPANVGISQNAEEILGGVTEPGVTVLVKTNSGVITRTVAGEDGRWIMVPNPVASGEKATISTIDPAGNQSGETAFEGAALSSYDLLKASIVLNTSTNSDNVNPSVTCLTNGNLVVIWQDGGDNNVQMQMYTADGIKRIGVEQQVNQRTNGSQDSPQVVALADGSFLIVWESNDGGLDNSGYGIVARRYGADGQALTEEFLVNTATNGAQRDPSVVALSNGGYVISWTDVSSDGVIQRSYDSKNVPQGVVNVPGGTSVGTFGGSEMAAFTDSAHAGMYITVWNGLNGPGDSAASGIIGQIFTADGRPLGDAFQINTTTNSWQNFPDVVTLKDGSFVVVFDSSDAMVADFSGIRAVRYSVNPTTGAVQVMGSGDFLVNSYTPGKQYKPVAVALEDGGYLVVWGSDGGDGSGSAIYAQRYSASNEKIGHEFLVNSNTQYSQGMASDIRSVAHILDATLMDNGNVFVSWQAYSDVTKKHSIEGIVVDVNASYYSEFIVNTVTNSTQAKSSTTHLSTGGFVVVWESSASDYSVKGQLFDAKGMPVGQEFLVNTSGQGDQGQPSVVELANGGFQVVWADSPNSSSMDFIKGQNFTYSYNSNQILTGVQAVGTEFTINSGGEGSGSNRPVNVALSDGGYMVVWQTVNSGKYQIYSHQYNANGSPVGGEVLVSATGLPNTEGNAFPSLAQLANGQIVVTYTKRTSNGNDVFMRTYDPVTHQYLSGELMVNQTVANNQASAKIAALDNGNYIVTWDSNNTAGPDQSVAGIWGRIYNAQGVAQGNEFLVNTSTPNNQYLAQVVSRADGSFVAVYASETDPAPGLNTAGIYAQLFDKNGNKIGQELRINQLTVGNQEEISATFLEGGQLFVSWTDFGVADGSGSAIKGRLIDLEHTLGLIAPPVAGTNPTQIAYQPAKSPVLDEVPPNVGIHANTKELLAGQTEPGAIVRVTDADGQLHQVVADAKGFWSISPNPLSVNEKGTIVVADKAGNQSEPILIRGSDLDNYNLLKESIVLNTSTNSDNVNPSVTCLTNGNLVVIWQDGGDNNVQMQMYTADGIKRIGVEQQVNQRTNGSQDSPQVVALADGSFLIVWESNDGGLDNSGYGIVARRYGADGQALTEEFLVNTATNGAQRDPSVVALSNGGYVISWTDVSSDGVIQRSYDSKNVPQGVVNVPGGTSAGTFGGSEMAAFTDSAHAGMYITVWNGLNGPGDSAASGIIGQIFAADGKPLGDAFQINTTTNSWQNFPDVVTLKDGSFVVVFDSSDAMVADFSGIRAVRYSVNPTTGAVQVMGSGDFLVNSYTPGKQYKPVAVALEDGGYLVVWGSDGGDGSGSAIYAQRYSASNEKIGHEFLVNSNTQYSQGMASDIRSVAHILDATLMDNGNVFVSWQAYSDVTKKHSIEGIVVDVNASYYSEFIVNTVTNSTQAKSSTTHLSTGGFVVVWESSASDYSVKGQLFDAKGMPVGQEFLVNTSGQGDQGQPSVVELANGGFQVVWADSPNSSSVDFIRGQNFTYSYNSNHILTGVQAVGTEFTINSGGEGSGSNRPVNVALSDGGYMVVWQTVNSGKYQIYSHQYNADGSPVGGEVLVSATGLPNTEGNAFPSLAQLANGQVVVTYTKRTSNGNDVFMRTYDPVTHQYLSGELMVNQTVANNQASAKIAALDNGNYIVTWDSNNTAGPDQSVAGIWGRIYNAQGVAQGNEFLVNTSTPNNQYLAQVVSRADGSFVAVYASETDPAPGLNTAGIYAQFFDKNGNKIGQELRINQLTVGNQEEISATFLEGGQLFVSWTDFGVADGSGSAIKGRLIDLEQTLGLTNVSGKGETHIEYIPATTHVTGTENHDVLDARGASTVDAKGGDDLIVINTTNFTKLDGGDGIDWLTWDSYSNFELGSVSAKIFNIEGINMANNMAQTLVIRPEDILDMKKSGEPILHITGDTGTNNNGAKDTVNIDLSLWSSSSPEDKGGVVYNVYTNEEDTTIQLWIQQGMNVV